MYKDALSLEKIRELKNDDGKKRAVMDQLKLVVLDDIHEEEECVYAVAMNPIVKRNRTLLSWLRHQARLSKRCKNCNGRSYSGTSRLLARRTAR